MPFVAKATGVRVDLRFKPSPLKVDVICGGDCVLYLDMDAVTLELYLAKGHFVIRHDGTEHNVILRGYEVGTPKWARVTVRGAKVTGELWVYVEGRVGRLAVSSFSLPAAPSMLRAVRFHEDYGQSYWLVRGKVGVFERFRLDGPEDVPGARPWIPEPWYLEGCSALEGAMAAQDKVEGAKVAAATVLAGGVGATSTYALARSPKLAIAAGILTALAGGSIQAWLEPW